MKRIAIPLIMAVMMLAAACGQPPEEKAVEQAYNDLLDAMEAQDGGLVFENLSSNTRDFLDRLADSMTAIGAGDYQNGADMFGEFLAGEDFGDYSRDVSSIVIEGESATLYTGDDPMYFILEEGEWKADFEGFIREGMEESLEGSGITVDDILDGNLGAGLTPVPGGYTVGQGTAAVTFINHLDGWDIHGVFIDPSDETEWSEERLGADYILTGDQAITVMVDPGTYDIQLVDEDGDTYSLWEVQIGPEGYQWEVTLGDMD